MKQRSARKRKPRVVWVAMHQNWVCGKLPPNINPECRQECPAIGKHDSVRWVRFIESPVRKVGR